MFKFVVKLLSCIWLCDLMDCSMPGFPSLHYLPEFAQTHVHWVSDAIQPSHCLSSPSPNLQSLPASGSFQISQLFSSGGQSIGASASTTVLPKDSQGWFPVGWIGLSLSCPRASQESSSSLQCASVSSLWSKSHIHLFVLHQTVNI